MTRRPFYFDPAGPPIDWRGSGSIVLANPEWISREPAAFEETTRLLPQLPAHVWVATSGSSTDSGRGRWVALSRQAFLASAAAVNDHLQASARDVWAHALPVFHVGGLGILARAHLAGSAVVAAVEGRWDAAGFHGRAAAARATLSALVPSQVHDLVAAGLRAPSSMRAIVIGGARLEPDLHRAARDLGWPCLPSYGLTETCSQVATASLDSLDSTACPAVLPILAHARIRADDDGRLAVQAESLLTCYAEIEAGAVTTWDPKQDGWLETEDLGAIRAGGIEVLGRASETVKVLGEMVSLLSVEERLRPWFAGQDAAAGGADFAVVALPHARRGHELVLAVTMAGERSVSDLFASLDAFQREALLPYERVQRVVRVACIPRTALGKCQRARVAREISP